LLVKSLEPDRLQMLNNKLLHFTKKYGDRRITVEALHWLEHEACAAICREGSGVLVAIHDSKLVGLSGAADFGRTIAFIVVHPLHRGKHIGQQLIRAHIEQMGQYNCSVAVDNLSSLKMCFRAGLSAVDLYPGVRGKPTLRMIGGQYLCPEPHLES
jgi:GNAT superfamily N-acetyltransferase